MKPYVWQGKREPSKPRPYTKIQCGTPSGYTFHYRIGQKPCPACTKAHNAYSGPQRTQRRKEAKAQQLQNADPGTQRLLIATAEAADWDRRQRHKTRLRR